MPISIRRFHPPSFKPSAELRWVLARSFSPADSGATRDRLDRDLVLSLARGLQLASRIAARQPAERLKRELGEEATSALRTQRRHDAAREIAIDAGLRRLTPHLERRNLPCVLLKLAALMRGGYISPGSRGGADIDILLSRSHLAELREHLLAAGYQQNALSEPEHQLPPFFDAAGCMLEVHPVILGVRVVDPRRSASYEDLESSGLLEPCSGADTVIRLPKREVLAAHALAHGLAQHGARPGDYPLFRMLADLQDLGVVGTRDDPVLAPNPAWLKRTVEAELLTAVAELIRRLGAPDPLPAEDSWLRSPAGVLLRHFVAAAMDERYRKELALTVLEPRLSDRRSLFVLGGTLFRAVYPTRADLEGLYGPNDSRLRLLKQRLWRPFDLALRLARALRARRRGDGSDSADL